MKQWIVGLTLVSSLGLVALFGVAAQSGTLKMVDCAKLPDNARCQRPGAPGSVGDGPTFNQGTGGDAIVGGFVQGNRAILAVKVSSGGAIIAVDLGSGNRELVAGRLSLNESQGKALRYAAVSGAKEVTEAYTLDGIGDVKPLPNGNFLAVVRRSIYRMELVEVDPKTGDRKLYWANELAEDTHPGGLRDKEKFNLASRCQERGANKRSANPTAYSVAVDAAGSAILQFNNNPNGIGFGYVRIRNGLCEDLSTYDVDLNDELGGGYKTPREEVNHMIVDGSTLYSVSYFADTGNLLGVNLETGDRKIVSHKDPAAGKGKGKGDVGVGTLGVALNAGGFWTTKETGDSFKLIRVDPKSGDRTLVPATAGPLLKLRGAGTQKVFALPGSDLLLISMDAVLTIFDPKTGNSNIVSM